MGDFIQYGLFACPSNFTQNLLRFLQICTILGLIACADTMSVLKLTFKAPITTAADDIHKYFFVVLQRK